jgi:hypothetical protein
MLPRPLSAAISQYTLGLGALVGSFALAPKAEGAIIYQSFGSGLTTTGNINLQFVRGSLAGTFGGTLGAAIFAFTHAGSPTTDTRTTSMTSTFHGWDFAWTAHGTLSTDTASFGLQASVFQTYFQLCYHFTSLFSSHTLNTFTAGTLAQTRFYLEPLNGDNFGWFGGGIAQAATGDSFYVGMRDEASDLYGWARFSTNNGKQFTLLDAAFNDTPGGIMYMGQTAIPEPSVHCMALLAMGVFGFRRLRAGRAAAPATA